MPNLILASGSPRRQQLLADAGFRFKVVAPADDAEPATIEGLSPTELVAELARLKAEDVTGRLRVESPAAEAVVLAADTVAECAGRVLGKPRDINHAREMLSWMSGQEHQVLTGVCLVGLGDQAHRRSVIEVVSTRLRMAPLSKDWLEPFLASGSWQGKAGAFGYQDGLEFVEIVQGSESNVVGGLPMERVTDLLRARGCIPGETEQA